MPTDFVSVISFLSPSELQIVKKQLTGNGVTFIVKECGGTIGYEDSDYFEVLVSPNDFSRAKSIVSKFKVTQFVKSRKCPKCGSMVNEPVTGLNIFQKLLYLGTSPVRCKKCKTKFVI